MNPTGELMTYHQYEKLVRMACGLVKTLKVNLGTTMRTINSAFNDSTTKLRRSHSTAWTDQSAISVLLKWIRQTAVVTDHIIHDSWALVTILVIVR